MKLIFGIMSAVLVLFVGFALWYRWDSGVNRGFQFGYYGEFNRVSNALASISGITVTQSWANCDVTLEEFGFTTTKTSGEPFRILVGESDPIRKLSGNSLVDALLTEIERQTNR